MYSRNKLAALIARLEEAKTDEKISEIAAAELPIWDKMEESRREVERELKAVLIEHELQIINDAANYIIMVHSCIKLMVHPKPELELTCQMALKSLKGLLLEDTVKFRLLETIDKHHMAYVKAAWKRKGVDIGDWD